MEKTLIAALKGRLIVQCQVPEDSPLHGPLFMSAMAAAAEQAGAGGIRADGPEDIAAIRARVHVPIIGSYRCLDAEGGPFITPDFACAQAVVAAGADVVALSCHRRQRPDVGALGELILHIQRDLGALVMADCATAEDGIFASEMGVDMVSTTLSGYTPETVTRPEPDLWLVEALAALQRRPVIAEGHIWLPAQARAVLSAGAHAVVVGTAITNPMGIIARFVAELGGTREPVHV